MSAAPIPLIGGPATGFNKFKYMEDISRCQLGFFENFSDCDRWAVRKPRPSHWRFRAMVWSTNRPHSQGRGPGPL